MFSFISRPRFWLSSKKVKGKAKGRNACGSWIQKQMHKTFKWTILNQLVTWNGYTTNSTKKSSCLPLVGFPSRGLISMKQVSRKDVIKQILAPNYKKCNIKLSETETSRSYQKKNRKGEKKNNKTSRAWKLWK